MKLRPSSILIFVTAAVACALSPGSFVWAEPGVPGTNITTSPAPVVAAPTPAATPAPSAPAPESPTMAPATTYTVVTGDSLWLIAHKMGCSVKALKKLNNLTKNNLKPGQVLKIPPATTTGEKETIPAPVAPAPAPSTPPPAPKPSASTFDPGTIVIKPLSEVMKETKPPTKTTAAVTKPKTNSAPKSYAEAQPVQDFDVPASTFASCPVPVAPDADPVPEASVPSAPVAKLVSPAEMETASVPAPDSTSAEVTPPTASVAPDADNSMLTSSRASEVHPAPITKPTPVAPPAPPPARDFFSSLNPFYTPPSNDWSTRFIQQARALGDKGIEYDEDWRPPGETHAWTMDCSNTARYLYKVTAGIDLPRTASDQYYYLHLQDKAWDLPDGISSYTECKYLRQNLKPGDLLFWENTYRPERQPPITHVMIFLGTDARGRWLMAGSQGSRGFYNRRRCGPDVYVFDPTHYVGGYTTWLGLVRHRGQFVAYGRPLEADVKKLSVATNE